MEVINPLLTKTEEKEKKKDLKLWHRVTIQGISTYKSRGDSKGFAFLVDRWTNRDGPRR
jgi:hypothetical protein